MFTYIFMLHMFQHFEFSVSPFGMYLRLEGPGNLLDGHPDRHPLRGEPLSVRGGADHAECPRAHGHEALVSLRDLPDCINQLHPIVTLLYCHSDFSANSNHTFTHLALCVSSRTCCFFICHGNKLDFSLGQVT